MLLSLHPGVISLREKTGAGPSVVIAGDTCPWASGIREIESGRTSEILGEVRPFINSADLRIVQFETPLADSDSPINKSGPNLRCPVVCRELLRDTFDVALLANNHIGDHGPQACLETVCHLHEIGVATAGVGATCQDAMAPLFLEREGMRIAILNFAEHEFGTATSDAAGSAPLDMMANLEVLRNAKREATLVFVVLHGGSERYPYPTPSMVERCRSFAEAGASLVMNIHTHCPQGIEVWNGTPIVYCPGNLYFPWADLSSPHLLATWWLGYLPKFHCDAQGVHALELLPYHSDNHAVKRLAPREETQFFEYMNRLSAPLDVTEPGAALPPDILRLYKIWVASGVGDSHVRLLKESLDAYPGDWNEHHILHSLLPARNLFSCETHRELMETYFRMIENHEVERFAALKEEVLAHQRPDYGTHYWEEFRGKGEE